MLTKNDDEFAQALEASIKATDNGALSVVIMGSHKIMAPAVNTEKGLGPYGPSYEDLSRKHRSDE